MVNVQTSIRKKIIFGYFIVLVMIIGFSLFAFIEMEYMEREILFGEVINEFFDTTLEMRRFEKNYFLYGVENDVDEHLRYMKKAIEIINGNTGTFGDASYGKEAAQISEKLLKYKLMMTGYRLAKRESALTDARMENLRNQIRTLGRDITNNAEKISQKEREVLRKVLSNSRRILIISILTLTILGLLVGHILSKIVVRPLKQLHDSLRLISEGGFEKIVINSKDMEAVSLANAFNNLLGEMELRRRHLIQSEKLASLGTLLSGVAHELNNPLSNISSSCQILIEEIEEGDIEYKKELLSNIDSQTNRARNIVRSLLDFAKDRLFKKDIVNLYGLLQETIRFIRGQQPSNVKINIDIPEDTTIYADKQRIQQVFLNLIKNGVDAIEAEGEISITARTIMHPDKCMKGIEHCFTLQGRCSAMPSAVDVMVKDTGSGMNGEILKSIFDPFFTTKEVGKGSGLGLFIVNEIIEEHGGCIAVSSEPGKGTSFLVRLPGGHQSS
ncbi:sensor histidine kinase [Candidatus Magnetominusculus dajiuhuensis]|uniref:sensor histidine kinase n=1 Tax=Candidatus Magnetominusculus dajiuhuensis TaxID=3137712 RepID=UPI003B430CC6